MGLVRRSVLRARLPRLNPRLWGGGLVPQPPGGGDLPAGGGQDLVMASISFHPHYLYIKLQEVNPVMEMMEEMEVTQEEMKVKLL